MWQLVSHLALAHYHLPSFSPLEEWVLSVRFITVSLCMAQGECSINIYLMTYARRRGWGTQNISEHKTLFSVIPGWTECIYSRQKLDGQESTRERKGRSPVCSPEHSRTYLRGGKDSVKSVCVQGICLSLSWWGWEYWVWGEGNELLEVCGLGNSNNNY